MIYETRKPAKIVEELSMFFFSIEAKKINSSIQIEDNLATITFEADYNPIYSHKFEKMIDYLKGPKDEAIEDEYWQLAGLTDDENTSELLLVGAMADSCDVKIDDKSVKIKIEKKLNI